MPAQPEQGCLKMKCAIAIAASLLFCWTCAVSTAATVTVDKPSPPPSCADGVCYPKVNTWGYYQRQWRPWPGAEELEPTPAEPMVRPVPGIPPYETPPPQEEDRRAPPPTKPAERDTPEFTPPATMPSPATPGTTPPGTAQPGATPPGGALRGGRPATDTPERREGESPRMPWDQSSGEWDPPPALPFGTAEASVAPSRRSAARPAGPQLRMPNDLPRRSSAIDSPPALPLALGGSLR